jgi:cobalt-zinc-cadmium efflux system protein
MAADAGVSLGVVAAGIAMITTGWLWLDPVISLTIVLIILIGTWGLIRDSANLALDAVPRGIDPHEVRDYLQNLDGVQEIHDLHIWAMSTTETALTAHLVQDGFQDPHDLTAKAAAQLRERFDIGHSTLQWERMPTNGTSRICTVDREGCQCRTQANSEDSP